MTMTHPAIDPSALDRLRRNLGSEPEPEPEAEPAVGGTGPAAPATVADRARHAARLLAAPLVVRARAELARAAAEQNAALRAEVAEVRDELVRTRTAHAAELAALHEELRNR